MAWFRLLDSKCLWIPGLKGSSHGDSEGLRGGSLGWHNPGGAKEQGWRIRDPMVYAAVAPWAYRVGLSLQCLLFF
jgi:hypothetical protein